MNPTPAFDGPEYVHSRDSSRLSTQLADVRDLMLDGVARTVAEIAEETGHPETSVSAQLRHLRKERFGSFDVRKRVRTPPALFEYFIFRAAGFSPLSGGSGVGASPSTPSFRVVCGCGTASGKTCDKCKAVFCDATGHEKHRCAQ